MGLHVNRRHTGSIGMEANNIVKEDTTNLNNRLIRVRLVKLKFLD